MPRPKAGRTRSRLRLRIDWGSGVVFLLIAVIALHFARNIELGTAPPSTVWSRSVSVGTSRFSIRPGADVLPDGSLLCAWAGLDGAGLARVSAQGEVNQVAATFPGTGPGRDARGFEVATAPAGGILLWTETHDGGQQLYQARLGADGRPVTGAGALALPVTAWAVARPATMTFDEPRAVLVQEGPRLRAFAVADDGGLTAFAAGPAVPDLCFLDGVVDGQGTLHVLATTKTTDSRYHFLYLTAQGGGFSAPLDVHDEIASDRNTLRQPGIALDRERVYFTWGVEETRPRTGKAATWWLSFRRDAPAPVEPQRLRLVPTRWSQDPSDMANDPVALSSDGDGISIAVSSMIMWTRLRVFQEIAVVSCAGQAQADTVAASFGRPASLSPALVAGDAGTYAAWLDTAGFNRYRVCVAGTAGSFRAAYAGRATADWLYAGLDTLVDLGWALGLCFTALLWVGLPFIIVGATQMVALDWSERRPRGLTLGVIALHVAGKLYFAKASYYDDVAVRAMMPAWLAHPVSAYLVPLLISAVALWAVIRTWRRRTHISALSSYGRFALIDVALTLLLYAPYLQT